MRNDLIASYDLALALGLLATMLMASYAHSGAWFMAWGAALGYACGIACCETLLWSELRQLEECVWDAEPVNQVAA